MVFKTSENIEYELSFASNYGYRITLKEQIFTEVKWLQFSSGKHFLLQGAILGSLKYDDFIYEVKEINFNECFFKIISKNRKTFISRKKLEIISCKLTSDRISLLVFFDFINALGMKNVKA